PGVTCPLLGVDCTRMDRLRLWHPPLACRPSPPQGGRSDGAALRLSPMVPIKLGLHALPISPLEGEMAGRPEGGALPHAAALPFTKKPAAALVHAAAGRCRGTDQPRRMPRPAYFAWAPSCSSMRINWL